MKTAVAGLGVIGTVHTGILKSMGLEPSAVCDTQAERCGAYPSAAAYTDYFRMLDAERPDVVHVCTPHYLHADMVVGALERGINVLCEKPLCIRAEDIPRILAAEERSGAQLGVCLQNRYNRANAFVKEYVRGKRVTDGEGIVAWHRDAAYYASGEWRGKWATEGGGVLINQALHTLDLLQWFVGMPDYVTAKTANLTLSGVIEVEDTAAMLCSGNADFSFFATNGSESEFPVEITLRAEGKLIKILSDRVLIDGEVQTFGGDSRVFGKYCYGTGHEALIADFYDCVRTGRKFEIDGAEGAKVVRLILAAYRSDGQKTAVWESVRSGESPSAMAAVQP